MQMRLGSLRSLPVTVTPSAPVAKSRALRRPAYYIPLVPPAHLSTAFSTRITTATIITATTSTIHLRSSQRLPNINFLRSFFSRATPATQEQVMAAKTKAQKIIDDNAVAVFSKSYCPYCKATKSLLSELGAKSYIIELDQVDDGAAIQDALQELTGQRSVPNIFIGQKHIGGNSDLQSKKSELPALLKSVNAV